MERRKIQPAFPRHNSNTRWLQIMEKDKLMILRTHTHIPSSRTVAQSLHSDSVRDGCGGGWGELGKAREMDVNVEEGKKKKQLATMDGGYLSTRTDTPPRSLSHSLSVSVRSLSLSLSQSVYVYIVFWLQCIHAGWAL